MIRVLVTDDQALVRQGIVTLLSLTEDIQVVGEAADGQEAIEGVLRLKPDVLLLDLRMPRVDGHGVLRALRERGSKVPVLVLTTFGEDDLFQALRHGAKGYLLKDVTLDQLTGAIRTLAAGGDLIHPALTERSQKGLSGPAQPDRPESLSPREKAVLRLMAAGCSNREVATALELAEGTVKNHASSILAKLGVRDRTRAVLKAFEVGWL